MASQPSASSNPATSPHRAIIVDHLPNIVSSVRSRGRVERIRCLGSTASRGDDASTKGSPSTTSTSSKSKKKNKGESTSEPLTEPLDYNIIP